MSLTKSYDGAGLTFSSALLFSEATYALPHWFMSLSHLVLVNLRWNVPHFCHLPNRISV